MLETLLLAPLGGLLYWVRGRGWPWGTTVNRLIWGIPTGTLIWFAASTPLWTLPLCVITSFFALIASGQSAHMGAGHKEMPTPKDGEWTETATHWWLPKLIDREKNQSLYDAVGLTAIAVLRFVLMMAPVVYWQPISALLLIAAPLHAASYFIAWKVKKHDPLPIAEAIWGTAIWASIVAVLEI